MTCDVAVIGAGPAGCATAMLLARMGASVVLFDARAPDRPHVGETLSPEIVPLLTGLGLWEHFNDGRHIASPGRRSVWGSPHLQEVSYLYNPYGTGWHLDRTGFDAMLVESAQAAGVHLFSETRVRGLARVGTRGWSLELDSGADKHQACAGFLVNASGRSTTLAPGLGARRRVYDKLIGALRLMTLRPGAPAADNFVLIEAVRNGWWYSATLPGSRLVVAFMTDGDLLAGPMTLERWQRLVEAAPNTACRLAAYASNLPPRLVRAASQCLERAVGDGWLAVGDAGFAHDPLSALGIQTAIESGVCAAAAIDRHAAGDRAALERYEDACRRRFNAYLAARSRYYQLEGRWPASTFWSRRRSFERE